MLYLLQEEILRNQRFQAYTLSIQTQRALPITLTRGYVFSHRLARDAAFARFAMALVAASLLGRRCSAVFLKVHHQLVRTAAHTPSCLT